MKTLIEICRINHQPKINFSVSKNVLIKIFISTKLTMTLGLLKLPIYTKPTPNLSVSELINSHKITSNKIIGKIKQGVPSPRLVHLFREFLLKSNSQHTDPLRIQWHFFVHSFLLLLVLFYSIL